MNVNRTLYFSLPYILNKEACVKFYPDDIVYGNYIVKVDEMTFVVVHDNPWWHWLLPMKINSIVDHFQKSGAVDTL